MLRRNLLFLLFTEGHAVGTLFNGGIALVGADQDPLQRAVICIGAVMCALLDGTFDTLVGMAVHNSFLLLM